jgi:LytR cell envelope-related transcriptional attenuator
VDHPLRPTVSIPPHAWRSAAMIASAVAAVELVLLVVAGSALLLRGGESASQHFKQAGAKATARTRTQTTVTTTRTHAHKTVAATTAAALPRGRVRVMVLNGNGRPGAAAAAAARVRHHGYRIGVVGNAARMSYSRSLVMYRPGFEGEGRRLGRDLGIRIVGPLDGLRGTQLHGAQVVLILGA